MINNLLEQLLQRLYRLCDTPVSLPPRQFVSHYVFNTRTGSVYQVRTAGDPELYGSLHSRDICAEHGGACETRRDNRVERDTWPLI
jgi:hypothetical protein